MGFGPDSRTEAADPTPGRNGWLALTDVAKCDGMNYQRSKIATAASPTERAIPT